MAYAGADWIQSNWPRWRALRRLPESTELSPLGSRVADILGAVWSGIYHLDPRSLRRADWSNGRFLQLKLTVTLATFDFRHLTDLVILCHDAAIRLEISHGKMRERYEGRCSSSPCLVLMFHQRVRRGRLYERHPTIEEAISNSRDLLNMRGRFDGN